MRLKAENVSFAYPGSSKGDEDRFIFKNVNLELDAGKILAILGPNGSGKTTFLRCLMGMLKLSSGTCMIDDKTTSAMSTKEFWEKVSYVPQQRMATSSFTVCPSFCLSCRPAVPLHKDADVRTIRRTSKKAIRPDRSSCSFVKDPRPPGWCSKDPAPVRRIPRRHRRISDRWRHKSYPYNAILWQV